MSKYEPITLTNKPLLQNDIVLFKSKEFKVNRWFKGNKHKYEFINQQYAPFEKSPSEVVELIKSKVITIKPKQ